MVQRKGFLFLLQILTKENEVVPTMQMEFQGFIWNKFINKQSFGAGDAVPN